MRRRCLRLSGADSSANSPYSLSLTVLGTASLVILSYRLFRRRKAYTDSIHIVAILQLVLVALFLLIFMAHYDTVSFGKNNMRIDPLSKMPGADFNASGVSLSMQLVKLLSE